ncbi:hypothetical protein GCM10007939_13500 [Amylibacter marinus]|uniref:Uncharacterized protein n=2 Tax=Amylibacter marinus TaxID=1475483 RepID=A0ABQ5VUF8_9RHOB|nr:hypothetical protein GCM10007939_13500 [Amylibacter marinus]
MLLAPSAETSAPIPAADPTPEPQPSAASPFERQESAPPTPSQGAEIYTEQHSESASVSDVFEDLKRQQALREQEEEARRAAQEEARIAAQEEADRLEAQRIAAEQAEAEEAARQQAEQAAQQLAAEEEAARIQAEQQPAQDAPTEHTLDLPEIADPEGAAPEDPAPEEPVAQPASAPMPEAAPAVFRSLRATRRAPAPEAAVEVAPEPEEPTPTEEQPQATEEQSDEFTDTAGDETTPDPQSGITPEVKAILQEEAEYSSNARIEEPSFTPPEVVEQPAVAATEAAEIEDVPRVKYIDPAPIDPAPAPETPAADEEIASETKASPFDGGIRRLRISHPDANIDADKPEITPPMLSNRKEMDPIPDVSELKQQIENIEALEADPDVKLATAKSLRDVLNAQEDDPKAEQSDTPKESAPKGFARFKDAALPIRKPAPSTDLSTAIPAAPKSGKAVFTDIDEINSSIEISPDEDEPEVDFDELEEPAKRGPFNTGFITAVALCVVTLLMYIIGPMLANSVPQTADFVSAFNGKIDSGRMVLQDMYYQGGTPGLSNLFENFKGQFSGG